MRIVRVLLALGAIGSVIGCRSDDDTVGVSQEALTSGYTTIGASWGTFGSGIKAVNRVALAEAGSVSKLSIYVDGNGGPTGTGVLKGIVYADASGQPGALLATSNEISVASGAAAGWKDLVFSSPVSLSAGNYFLGVLVGGAANVIRETYDVQTGIMRYDADAYADGASNPYGTATTFNNKMSLYATYTATQKTFGYTTVGASWGIFGSGIKAVNRFALSEAGNVSKLSIHLDGNGGATGTGVLKGIVYADTGGQPGALLATSNEISVASGAAAGWRDLVFSSPVSLSTGNYFLGVLVGGTANVIRETYDVQTGIMRYDADAYADGASNPYGTATTYNNKMSLYATYAGGGTTSGPTLAYSPSSLSFGNVTVGSASAAKTLTVTNSGAGNLVLSAATLTGSFVRGAASPTECVLGSAYAPGASCTITVSFAPQTAGVVSGTLTVTNNAPNSPHTISLSGTGVATPGGFDTRSPGAGWELFYPNATQAPAFQNSLSPADHPLQNGSSLGSAVYVFTQGSGNVSVQDAPGGRTGKVMMMTVAAGTYGGNNRAQVMATIPNASPYFGDKNHVWLWKFSVFYPSDFNLEPANFLHLDPHGDSVNAAHTDDIDPSGAFKFQIWGGAGQGPDWTNILTEYKFGTLSAFTGKWVDYEFTIKPNCTNGNGIIELRVNSVLMKNTQGGTRWTGPNSFCINRDGTSTGELTNFQIGPYIWEQSTVRPHRMYVGPMTIWRRNP